MTFNSFNLHPTVLTALNNLNFTNPTQVQQQAIPLVLNGKDLLVSSKTGTGKTGAFAIPIVSALHNNPKQTAIIITPTRELATQVLKTFTSLLAKGSPCKVALLIGGESIGKQLNDLQRKPNIIVGTPGRINDHLKRNSLNLSAVKFLVLDETDRMLDMGFSIQINEIIKHIPQGKQTLLFSATFPQNIVDLSANYMNNPEKIFIGDSSTPVEKIKQEIINIAEADKHNELLVQLNSREGSVIVFVKTKYNAERMAKKLKTLDFKSDALHGDLRHNKREKITADFRAKKFNVLIATDIAARGLDIPHVQHVINYDLPQCPEDYIHRIGRTGRAGQSGEAVSFVSNQEKDKWKAIYYLLNPNENPKANKSVRPKKPKASKFNNASAKNGNTKPYTAQNSTKSNFARGGKKQFNPLQNQDSLVANDVDFNNTGFVKKSKFGKSIANFVKSGFSKKPAKEGTAVSAKPFKKSNATGKAKPSGSGFSKPKRSNNANNNFKRKF